MEVHFRIPNPDAMFSVLKLTVFLLFMRINEAASPGVVDFTYNGFSDADMGLNGIAEITSNGLLILTDASKRPNIEQRGRAFYVSPINFLDPSSSGGAAALSFSTTFVFAIIPKKPELGGHGIAFFISPTTALPSRNLPGQYLGLFNASNIGNGSNHLFAVAFETEQSIEFNDINDNHVGIDINGLQSVESASASYFDKNGRYKNLSLISGDSMQAWVNYDGVHKQLNVTIAPINVSKPAVPLLSMSLDLSPLMKDPMFIGFSSSTGSLPTSHCVSGWSFKLHGRANELNLTQLPTLSNHQFKQKTPILIIVLPVIAAVLVLATIFGILIMVKRKRKYAQVLEEWEHDYGTHRFNYKDLYVATKGFKNKELLGIGGFGKVYKGVLPNSNIEVAVKKISHNSRQGMKEFVAEIVTIGQLRHRNLATLLGYCRRKGELLLVYECMPNGSLDKFLFDPSMPVLNWSQRFRIIRGVASALFYLHEGWDQVVVHRDVKSSNVLLDGEFNARLGDFGLARSYNHGTDPQTTHVAGTLGYLAPELSRTGKANPNTDVFAFGTFMLEVACGRKPINPRASTDQDLVLVDWVFSCWSRGAILDTVDPKLGINYVEKEMELVLKLGLLCSNWVPTGRPPMRHVLQYLEEELPLPDLSSLSLNANGGTFVDGQGFDDLVTRLTVPSPSVSEWILSGGR
ncbi:L-type lectin-domain containing receptor kinase SIT2-like [Macadamia integrifolia]|uniref:L-type lectin-domain containing receptor kinase SIT2-like n=1 Tax=Macadamia integrifolia TaxID=60698 RepID=UPI001C4EB8A4|nr:L-type lectin-domain containing receptor kinase SIT2-like [Macadamia integrifolia]